MRVSEYLEVTDGITQRVEVYRVGSGEPHLLVTGGLHGGEATGQHAAFELLKQLDGLDVGGQVTVIPRANLAAFRRAQRTSPYDEQDMNRIFPGRIDGTMTEALAHRIWQIARGADYIVDLHCCGIHGSAYTLAQYREYDYARRLAGRLDVAAVVQSAGAAGQLFVEAAREGTPAVIIELPGGGPTLSVDLAASDMTVCALVNLLRLLDIIPGEGRQPSPTFYPPLERLTVDLGGLFLPQVMPGDEFERGQVLAVTEGREIRAPGAGRMVMMRPPGYVFAGETVAATVQAADNDD